MNEICTIDCAAPFVLSEDILCSEKPLLLKNIVAHWPIVKAAKTTTDAVVCYLNRFYSGLPIVEVQGGPEIGGRVGYTSDLKSLNCVSSRKSLMELLENIFSASKEVDPPLYYMGTTHIDSLLPGFHEENDLEISGYNSSGFMWIGNKSCISAHYDLPDNIACNTVGRRRFTLFPPAQVGNLYIGPLDFTPAGQSISLVDIRDPDFERFPKFKDALASAYVVELEPGDAIFIPSMWWHSVEGLDDLNILVNYWWRRSPGYMSSPADVLDLALLTIRDLPKAQKQAWKNLLDHYVFNVDDETAGHVPVSARGSIGELNEDIARQLRAKIMSRLNR